MKIKTLIVLFFLLLIPLPTGCNRRKIKPLTVRALRRVLTKSGIIAQNEIRRICQAYRAKLREKRTVSREDIMDILVEITRDEVRNVPEYISWEEYREKLTQVWQKFMKGSSEADVSELGFGGYLNLEVSPEELLSRYGHVLTTFAQHGLLTEKEKGWVRVRLHDYQILFRSSLFEHCRLAMSEQKKVL